MVYKKLMFLNLLVFMVFQQNLMPGLSSGEQISATKRVLREVSRKAFGGWAFARTWPAAVGASMVVIPPTAVLLGFMGTIGSSGGSSTKNESGYLGMMIGGAVASYVGIPLGMLLIGRQGFLISRDLSLFSKFTESIAYHFPGKLPDAQRIASMKTHHELLSMAQKYVAQEGNFFEKLWLYKIPGLRGFKYQNIE